MNRCRRKQCSLVLYQLKNQVFSQMHLGKANSNVASIAQARLKSYTDGKLKKEKAKTKRVYISSSYFQFLLLFLLCHILERALFFSPHNTFIKRQIKKNKPVIQNSDKKIKDPRFQDFFPSFLLKMSWLRIQSIFLPYSLGWNKMPRPRLEEVQLSKYIQNSN